MIILRAIAGLVFLTVFMRVNIVLAETSSGVRGPTA